MCLKPLSPRLNESLVGFSFPRNSCSEFAGARWDDLVVVGVASVTLVSALGWFLVFSPEPFGCVPFCLFFSALSFAVLHGEKKNLLSLLVLSPCNLWHLSADFSHIWQRCRGLRRDPGPTGFLQTGS